MNVRLIALTQPSDVLVKEGITTAEQLIVYAARVSNPSNKTNTGTGPRLLRYCIRYGHWSVFETASMTIEVVTSRAIAAQLLRHRSFTFQEFSQRYAESVNYEDVELRTQDTKNRQGSGSVYADEYDRDMVQGVIEDAFLAYKTLLGKGVSRETARMVLPLCTQTTLYMTGSVRSWIHYLEQRTSDGTQKEHREIAEAIRAIFNDTFPWTAEALKQTD